MERVKRWYKKSKRFECINKVKDMDERIENIISNVYCTRRVGKFIFYYAVFYYFYNLIFTDKRIVGEFIDKTHVSHNRHLFTLTYVNAMFKERNIKKNNVEEAKYRRNLDGILKEKVENFSLDYQNIDKIYIHKKFFKIETSQYLPFVQKNKYFHFDKNDRHSIKSIFLKYMPLKTQSEKIPFNIKLMGYFDSH